MMAKACLLVTLIFAIIGCIVGQDPANGWMAYALGKIPSQYSRITKMEATWTVGANAPRSRSFYSPWFGMDPSDNLNLIQPVNPWSGSSWSMYTEYYQWSPTHNSNSKQYSVQAGQTLKGSIAYDSKTDSYQLTQTILETGQVSSQSVPAQNGKKYTVPYFVYEKVFPCSTYPPDEVVTFRDISVQCDNEDCTNAVQWSANVKDANCDMKAVISNQTTISITWDTSAKSVYDNHSIADLVKLNANGWARNYRLNDRAKQKGMIASSNQNCEIESCNELGTHEAEGESFCASAGLWPSQNFSFCDEGMIDVNNGICESCHKHSAFNIFGQPPHFCSTLKIDHSFIVEGERFCHKPADAQILGLKKCSECQLLAILTEEPGVDEETGSPTSVSINSRQNESRACTIWMGYNICNPIMVLSFFSLLALTFSLISMLHLHHETSIDTIQSTNHVSPMIDVLQSSNRHRKFVGDYANAAKDVDNNKQEMPSVTSTAHISSKINNIDKHDVSAKSRQIILNNTSVSDSSNINEGCLTSIGTADKGIHTVPPPVGLMTLVCCQTTKGVLNIAVHPQWAPIGAENFLTMVESKFFSSKVPLFRALKGFLVQFGLSGDPAVQRSFEKMHMKGRGGLLDDPQWLPQGPPGRVNQEGVKRFRKGYMAYAGAGKNSRGTQLIMSFEDNEYLGGGSPWEVPWGHLFGPKSYETLQSIYTKYGEKVSQGKIRNRGLEYLESEFPLVDYITQCDVMARNVDFV